MDFAALICFLIIYYVRPQEWMLSLQPFRPVTLVMIFAIVAVFMRAGGITRKAILKTPHDWFVLIYCLWIVAASQERWEVFGRIYPLYLFYAVTVQVLDSMDRIQRFLVWWAIMIFVMTGMAVLSEYGFDPTGAYDITHGKMHGRLSLGTSIFNNPNALGHSAVPVILMLYFLLIWRRPIFIRLGSIPLFAVPLYCIYLTVSKGAFISGFASLVGALTFGRPKVMQVLILAGAITIGWAGIKTLPRMQEMSQTKTDGAIQGRVQSFEFGLRILETKFDGVGHANFPTAKGEATGIYKAAHSSYVQIGGELGKTGLFLFLSILYCCLRSLVTARTRDIPEERVRRVLFSMIISYMVSSWMVDYAYRAALFLFVGAIAAFHRQLLKKLPEPVGDSQTVPQALTAIPSPKVSGHGPAPAVAVATAINQTTMVKTTLPIPAVSPSAAVAGTNEGTKVETDPPGITWNRFGWLDVVLCVVMFKLTIRFWRYAIAHF